MNTIIMRVRLDGVPAKEYTLTLRETPRTDDIVRHGSTRYIVREVEWREGDFTRLLVDPVD